MDVVIEREPCYLLEAAELAYSLVNDIPAEKLSGTGLYCIPAEAIQRIRREACAGIESHQTALDFYFRQVTVGAEGEEVSCLGSCMLYTALKSFSSDAAQMCRELTQNWRAMRSRGLRITSIRPKQLAGRSGLGQCSASMRRRSRMQVSMARHCRGKRL